MARGRANSCKPPRFGARSELCTGAESLTNRSMAVMVVGTFSETSGVTHRVDIESTLSETRLNTDESFIDWHRRYQCALV